MAVFSVIGVLILSSLSINPQDESITGYRAEVLREIDGAANRIISLAEAVPAEQYEWRPADGVRSFREIFLHIAEGNYSIPSMIGVNPPEWYEPRKLEQTVTAKADVVDALRISFDHLRSAVRSIEDTDMDRTIRWFGGRENTVRGVLLFIPKHTGEHQGQLIAYARVNGIVPPWSR